LKNSYYFAHGIDAQQVSNTLHIWGRLFTQTHTIEQAYCWSQTTWSGG